MRRSFMVLGLVAASACSSFSTESQEPPPPPDPSTCTTACPDGLVCREGACVCPDGILYVAPSPQGSDGNTGCAKEKPKATIKGALAFAQTLGLKKHELHVCRGVYNEKNLRLTHPTTMRGGYECSLWTRSDNWGFKPFADGALRTEGFDGVNETRIETDDGTTPALEIAGKAIDRSVVLEGFTIVGRAGTGEGAAVRMQDEASPTITDNVVLGALETGDDIPKITSIG